MPNSTGAIKQMLESLAQQITQPAEGALRQAAKQVPAIYQAPMPELRSPGRRKFLQQAAASTARVALPNVLGGSLISAAGRQALKGLMTSSAIPDEAIQAAITASMRDALTHPDVQQMLSSRVGLGMHLPAAESTMTKFLSPGDLEEFLPAKHHQGILDAYDSLHPDAIAQRFGLPSEDINAYAQKVGESPRDAFMRLIDELPHHDQFMEDTPRAQFQDHGFDSLPLTDEEHASLMDSVRHNDPDSGYDAVDAAHELYQHSQARQAEEPYVKLLGPKNFATLKQLPNVPDPRNLALDKLDALEADDRVDAMLGDHVYNLEMRLEGEE